MAQNPPRIPRIIAKQKPAKDHPKPALPTTKIAPPLTNAALTLQKLADVSIFAWLF